MLGLDESSERGLESEGKELVWIKGETGNKCLSGCGEKRMVIEKDSDGEGEKKIMERENNEIQSEN